MHLRSPKSKEKALTSSCNYSSRFSQSTLLASVHENLTVIGQSPDVMHCTKVVEEAINVKVASAANKERSKIFKSWSSCKRFKRE